ncbi:MAG: DUF2461 domain-containing protein [Bacteroidota bacterium]
MIHPNTFTFLNELKEHNVKEWFDENRGRYQEARKNVIDVVDDIIDGIIDFDDSLRGIDPKKCLFRINRDVRFSANKDPYKTNFGASIAKGGKKSGYAGYYVNIDPSGCFAGGGFYMPPSPVLKKIREYIDLNGERLEEIIQEEKFVKTFRDIDRGPELKTAPKGFPKDHPHIHLLRKKSFTAINSFSSKDFQKKNMVDEVVETFEALAPFVHFLNDAMDNS